MPTKSEPAAPDPLYRVFRLSNVLDHSGFTRLCLPSFGRQPGSTGLMINCQAVYRPSLVESSRVTMGSFEQ